MNPDAYFPFYALDFWQAVKGHPPEIAVAYLKALTHYWCHEHCKGLKDDTEYLRRICELDEKWWETAQAIIFDNDHFFTLGEDGLWHQKRMNGEWVKAVAAYEAAVKGGKNRWKGIHASERARLARRAIKGRWSQ